MLKMPFQMETSISEFVRTVHSTLSDYIGYQIKVSNHQRYCSCSEGTSVDSIIPVNDQKPL